MKVGYVGAGMVVGFGRPMGEVVVRVIPAKKYAELYRYLSELPHDMIVERRKFRGWLSSIFNELIRFAREVSDYKFIVSRGVTRVLEELRDVEPLYNNAKVVIIEGPPGIGKTHCIAGLISTFLATGAPKGYEDEKISMIAYFAPTHKLLDSTAAEIERIYRWTGWKWPLRGLALKYVPVMGCTLNRKAVERALELFQTPTYACRVCPFSVSEAALATPKDYLARVKDRRRRVKLEALLRFIHKYLASKVAARSPVVRVIYEGEELENARSGPSFCLRRLFFDEVVRKTTRKGERSIYVRDDFGYFRDVGRTGRTSVRIFRAFLATHQLLKTLPYLTRLINSERPRKHLLWVFDEADYFYTHGWNLEVERPKPTEREVELLSRHGLLRTVEMLTKTVYEAFTGTYTLPREFDRVEKLIDAILSELGDRAVWERIQEAKREAVEKGIPFKTSAFLSDLYGLALVLRRESDYAILEITKTKLKFLNVSMVTELLFNPTLPALYTNKIIFSATFKPAKTVSEEEFGIQPRLPAKHVGKAILYSHITINYMYKGLTLIIFDIWKLIRSLTTSILPREVFEKLDSLFNKRLLGQMGLHEVIARAFPGLVFTIVYHVHRRIKEKLGNPEAAAAVVRRLPETIDPVPVLKGNVVLWLNSKKSVMALIESARRVVRSCRFPRVSKEMLDKTDSVTVVCRDEEGDEFLVLISWFRSRLSRGISTLGQHYLGSIALLPALAPPAETFIDQLALRARTSEVIQSVFRVVRRPDLGVGVIALPDLFVDMDDYKGYAWDIFVAAEEVERLYDVTLIKLLHSYAIALEWRLEPQEVALVRAIR